VLIIDVLLLAGLYTLRVLSGGIAVSVTISPWLLAFSMFLFLSLAILKRYSELRITQERHQTQAWGRSYAVGDIDLLRSIGPTSGYLSVLVLALYINSKEVIPLYHHPATLWFIGPCLLYWLTRMWLLAHRGEMADDPLVFSGKDPQSYVVGILIAAIIVLASV
jgi:4-hydroxybenzoate polyprenyltransferase